MKSIFGKKTVALFLVLILVVGSLVACGKKEEKEEEVVVETEEVQETEQETSDHYPVTITTYNYNKEPIELTFEKAPEKVIAVYQNSIETLLALGLEDKIVLASGLDHDVKDEYKDAFEVVEYNKDIPSKEEALGLEPDFILSWYSIFDEKRLGDVTFWNERGVNTFIAQNSGIAETDSLENEYEDILTIGKIFDVEEKAEEIVNQMKEKIEETSKEVADKEKVDAIIVEVGKENTYRVYGENSIGGNIATSVGANLVAKDNGTIGAEDLVSLNPQVIFTVYYGDQIAEEESLKLILDNPKLQSVDAVKEGRVYAIALSEVYASGVRTYDGIVSIINGLYPEMNK